MGYLIMAIRDREGSLERVVWNSDRINLFNRMERWLTEGLTWEILEYCPVDSDEMDYSTDYSPGERCGLWTRQLRKENESEQKT